jgi:DNA-binding transcriptional regulator YiaG
MKNSLQREPSRTAQERQLESAPMTGAELKQLRVDLGDAIGRPLSAADMAKLCGLASGDGADTIRRWEIAGPSGPAGELLRILAMASDRHPILEKFNVFDRFNIPENERPARRQEFREKMRDEIRRRLA